MSRPGVKIISTCFLAIGIVLCVGISACSLEAVNETGSNASGEKAITKFMFAGFEKYPVNIVGNHITCLVPCNVDISALTAVFETTAKYISVNEVIQSSGSTQNDFSSYQVAYDAYAEDGSYERYLVSVKRQYVAEWARVPTTPDIGSAAHGICISDTGETYLVGSYEPNWPFITKYDSYGNEEWRVGPSSSSAYLAFYSISTQGYGGWYALGTMEAGAVKFPGLDEFSSSGLSIIILFGLADGTVSNALCIPLAADQRVFDIKLDGEANIIIVGSLGYDQVVQKYNALGTLLWTYIDDNGFVNISP